MLLVLKRLLLLPLILLAVAVMTFLLAAASPFDPVLAYVGAESLVGQKVREEIARAWGLDRPLPEQLARWLGHVVRGDLGHSRLFAGKPVAEVIVQRAIPSAVLVGGALVLTLVGGLVAGVLAAAFRDSWFDWLVRAWSTFNISAPSYWVALLALYLFSVRLNWLPGAGTADLRGAHVGLDLRHMVLPMVTLALTQLAWFTLYVRNTLLEVLREDYVRFAQACGLGRWRILFRHALPNASLPFLTLMGTHMSEIIGGAALIENVFAWPGLGKVAVDAGLAQDMPLLLAITLASSSLVVLGNLLADIGYWILDPRVREGLT